MGTQPEHLDHFHWGFLELFSPPEMPVVGRVGPDLNQRVGRRRLLAFTEWGLIEPGTLPQVPSSSWVQLKAWVGSGC